MLLTYFNGDIIYANDPTYFTIDWANNLLLLPPQPVSGILSYTILGVGDAEVSGNGIIDYQSTPVVTTSNGISKLISMVNFNEVKTAYVTVDGIPVDSTPYPQAIMFYEITTASNRDTRATVSVHNMTTGSHLIQSWFFSSDNPLFNKIVEQQIYATDYDPLFIIDENGFAAGELLNATPAKFGTPSSQVIVEIIPDNGNRIRLRAPYVTYYKATNIDVTQGFYPIVASTSSFIVDQKNIQVFLNGSLLTYGDDQDYIITGNNSVQITGRPALFGNLVTLDSTIAIETFYPNNISNSVAITDGSVIYDYDFMLAGSPENGYTLLLAPDYSFLTSSTVRAVTFSIQDSLGMIPQRFVSSPTRSYRLNHPVINSNYLWIEVDTSSEGLKSLSTLDYQLLDDHQTVVIGANIVLSDTDTVFINSFADPSQSAKTIGYRITKDFLGGTSFTRLSSADTTYLTQPLTVYDTEIHIADGSLLSPADASKNHPGVVLIAGERIEFFKNVNNVLSQLRRGTGGTSLAQHLSVGTLVMDQGINQIINVSPATPYSDVVLVQNTYTSARLENTYIISTATISTWVNPITSSSVRCDGIKLLTSLAKLPTDAYTGKVTYKGRIYSVSTASIQAKDQIEVYYGGRLLQKDQHFYHDTTISYDGISITQIKGEIPTVTDLANVLPYIGNAYICQDTNEVWVCTQNQFNIIGVPNFVYSGLIRVLPDFNVNTATQQITLNTATVKIHTGTQLTIIQRQVGTSWNDVVSINTTTSLIDSTGVITKFLKDGPAVLPSHYFYGSTSTAVSPTGGLLT